MVGVVVRTAEAEAMQQMSDKLQQVRQGARDWKRQCKEARKALAEMTAVQEALLADNERLGDRLAKTLSREREQADAAAELAYELRSEEHTSELQSLG